VWERERERGREREEVGWVGKRREIANVDCIAH
jgi:hypothetical protein